MKRFLILSCLLCLAADRVSSRRANRVGMVTSQPAISPVTSEEVPHLLDALIGVATADPPPPKSPCVPADFNCDGDVDQNDFGIFQQYASRSGMRSYYYPPNVAPTTQPIAVEFDPDLADDLRTDVQRILWECRNEMKLRATGHAPRRLKYWLD